MALLCIYLCANDTAVSNKCKNFFLNISYFSKHILSKFILKKKKKLITMYKLFYFKCKISVLSVSVQTGEMAEYQPAPTERAISNAIPYRVPDVTYNLIRTKKTFDMQSINYPNNYTSPNKILVIRQNAHLVLRNVGKTL